MCINRHEDVDHKLCPNRRLYNDHKLCTNRRLYNAMVSYDKVETKMRARRMNRDERHLRAAQ